MLQCKGLLLYLLFLGSGNSCQLWWRERRSVDLWLWLRFLTACETDLKESSFFQTPLMFRNTTGSWESLRVWGIVWYKLDYFLVFPIAELILTLDSMLSNLPLAFLHFSIENCVAQVSFPFLPTLWLCVLANMSFYWFSGFSGESKRICEIGLPTLAECLLFFSCCLRTKYIHS